jgi:hypothetical protein
MTKRGRPHRRPRFRVHTLKHRPIVGTKKRMPLPVIIV